MPILPVAYLGDLPSVAELSGLLSEVPAFQGELPSSVQFRTPADWFPVFPPMVLADFSAEATLTANACPVAAPPLVGIGTFTAKASAVTTAEFGGEGSLFMTSYDSDVDFVGQATFTATAVPVVASAGSGAGTFTAAASAAATADVTAAGTFTAIAIPIAAAMFSSTATLTAPAQAVFTATKMIKNASAYSITDTWSDIPGWVPDTTNYPGSTTSGNALVIHGSNNATLKVSAPFSGGSGVSARAVQVRLLVNNVVAATGTAVSGDAGTAICEMTRNVVDGDLITAQVIRTGSWFAIPGITASTAYVQAT